MNTHYLYSIIETSLHTGKVVHTCKPSSQEASLGFRAKKESIQHFTATTRAAQTTTAACSLYEVLPTFPLWFTQQPRVQPALLLLPAL